MTIYLLCISFISSILLSNETPMMTSHKKINSTYNGEYLLCTNSGNFGVDCGIFSIENHTPVLLLSTHIKNEPFTSFTNTIGLVLNNLKNNYNIAIHHACFAGPGVPSAEQDYLTHVRLPYTIDAKEIIATYGLVTAIIVNDFLAMSYGIDFLDNTKIITLYDAPAEHHGRRIIIGAGSGLGTVSMIWNEQQQTYHSLPAEAGTGDFPSHNQFEFDLAMEMKQLRNMNTVHWANFVSLSGIQYTYQMLKNMTYENCYDKNDLDGIAILANSTSDACCSKTADLFFKFYARFTYNFVWSTLPFGGIYLVGETATNYPGMLSTIFLTEYFNCVVSKQSVLKRIPIYIIKDEVNLGLYGTANYFLIEKKQMMHNKSLFTTLHNKFNLSWSNLKNSLKRLF